jgi:alpha-galactosidase
MIMNKNLKIVYIGAGSAVFGISNLASIMRSKRLSGSEIVLVDTNEPSLEKIAQLGKLMNQAWDAGMLISSTTNRQQALPGADYVIISVQVGQRETVWEQDWKIPLEHGIRQPYAENSGPGAFAHTARNTPIVLEIAKDMERFCPDAWCLNFTNPLIRLTWVIARYSNIKVLGLCHQLYWAYAMAAVVMADRWGLKVPEGFNLHTDYANLPNLQRMIADGIARLDIKAAGINHFSWVYDIRDKKTGEDLYPLLRQSWMDGDLKNFEPLSRELFNIFGLMPTAGDSHICEYLPWVHDPISKPWEKYHLKLQDWMGNRQRRKDSWERIDAYIEGSRSIDELQWTISEGVPEIIEAATFGTGVYYQQLNLPNQGLIPNLPTDAIVEVPGIISQTGIFGFQVPPLPDAIAELIRRELALSSLVVDACVSGDRKLALQALLLDPMMNDIDRARVILNDFLETFAEYLPQFN